jgi:hypothetical protein
MYRDQNAGQNGYIQIGNKSFETVEQIRYLGTMSSTLLSKYVKIKIYRTIMLPVVKVGHPH